MLKKLRKRFSIASKRCSKAQDGVLPVRKMPQLMSSLLLRSIIYKGKSGIVCYKILYCGVERITYTVALLVVTIWRASETLQEYF